MMRSGLLDSIPTTFPAKCTGKPNFTALSNLRRSLSETLCHTRRLGSYAVELFVNFGESGRAAIHSYFPAAPFLAVLRLFTFLPRSVPVMPCISLVCQWLFIFFVCLVYNFILKKSSNHQISLTYIDWAIIKEWWMKKEWKFSIKNYFHLKLGIR